MVHLISPRHQNTPTKYRFKRVINGHNGIHEVSFATSKLKAFFGREHERKVPKKE